MHPLLPGLALTAALIATPALARDQEPDPVTPNGARLQFLVEP